MNARKSITLRIIALIKWLVYENPRRDLITEIVPNWILRDLTTTKYILFEGYFVKSTSYAIPHLCYFNNTTIINTDIDAKCRLCSIH